jgi:anti-sigma regulatory factor (Ser/Thr protein kinase)
MTDTLSVDLPPRPESAGWARDALAEFRHYLDEEAYMDLRLVVSELVTDAILSDPEADDEITVQIGVQRARLHVSVRDGASAYEGDSERPRLGERGWGVYFARILTDWWGTQHNRDGGCVWLEMQLAHA